MSNANIKIRGFEKHVSVPITVNMNDDAGSDDGFELKFNVSYLRMTRSVQEKMYKAADSRTKKAHKIQQKIQKELESVNDEGEPDVDQSFIDDLEAQFKKLATEGEEATLSRIVGWDLVDDDDEPVKFNKANLRELADHTDVYIELVGGMWLATGGRLKN